MFTFTLGEHCIKSVSVLEKSNRKIILNKEFFLPNSAVFLIGKSSHLTISACVLLAEDQM